MRVLVGYTGFVGSNLCRFVKFDKMYNSKNFHDAINTEIEELYFCGMPAEKWKANLNPQNDDLILQSIIDILNTMRIKKFILISTVDVYDNLNNKDENYIPDEDSNHKYGSNRYRLEKFVMQNFEDHYIFRLPALFGLGLKKNIIYDLLKNNNICKIPIESSFQWYFLDWLYQDINTNIRNNRRIVNLITEPLQTIEIIKLFQYDQSDFTNKNTISYDLKTIYDISGYFRSKEECLLEIEKFINFESLCRKKLRVSNICCKNISYLQFATILKCYGINNVQIAPTTLTNGIWDFEKIDYSPFSQLKISSLQSITYGLQYNIFNSEEDRFNLLNHIKLLSYHCKFNNINGLIFGCPKTRNINFEITDLNTTKEIFISFFRDVGKLLENTDIYIYIEPNATKYVNFLNGIFDTAEIVLQINHPNIKLMLDIGHLNENELYLIYQYRDIIYNIDISNETMSHFNNDLLNSSKFNTFKLYLNNIEYNRMINLEMLCDKNNAEDELIDLNHSIKNFIQYYN